MRIARELLDEMVAHAREESPNECCGMVAAQDGRAVEVLRATNAADTPRLSYNVDPRDLHRIVTEIEDSGRELGAIYHSHPRTAPQPSQTDVNLAFLGGGEHEAWPGTLYVIVGLAGPEPEVRAFRIASKRRVEEVELEVEG